MTTTHNSQKVGAGLRLAASKLWGITKSCKAWCNRLLLLIMYLGIAAHFNAPVIYHGTGQGNMEKGYRPQGIGNE